MKPTWPDPPPKVLSDLRLDRIELVDEPLLADGFGSFTVDRSNPEVPEHGYLTTLIPNWPPKVSPTDCVVCKQDLGDGYDDFNYCPYCGAEL